MVIMSDEIPIEKQVEMLKEFALNLMKWQAITTIPLIEKYGEEALEFLKQQVYDLTYKEAKRRYKSIPEDKRSIADFREEILYRLLLPVSLLGSKGRCISMTEKEMVSEDLSCAFNNVWREVTNKPVIMCELYDQLDRAYANAFNKNLDYTQYGKGLALNENRCGFIMKMSSSDDEE